MAKKTTKEKSPRPNAGEDGEPPAGGTGSMYFDPAPSGLTFFSSGCSLLNCVLGGGWPLGRVSNVVGDEATGKTLIAIEGAANLARKFPDAEVLYVESESAFDVPYASSVGLPVDRLMLPREGPPKKWDRGEPCKLPGAAVEDVFRVIDLFLHDGVPRKRLRNGKLADDDRPVRKQPGLIVIDSLDALSDTAELGREMGEGSYGMGKPKAMSEMFRRLVGKVEQSDTHFMIVSQLRDKIDAVSFGEKKTRAGGRALNYYSSQIIWLSRVGKESLTRKGITKVVGENIKVRNKKNKIGPPFRECEFQILFNYGIEDVLAAANWLKTVNRWDKCPTTVEKAQQDPEERKRLNVYLRKQWAEVEAMFAPGRRKYQ